MKEKKRVLAILDNLIPSNIISIIKPMLKLQEQGEITFHVCSTKKYKEKDIIGCDVVILCRDINVADLEIIRLVKKHKKLLVYDIDDNFFLLSIKTPLGRYHRYPIHLYTLTKMLEQADVVRVYSRPMEKIARMYTENVEYLKSYFDFTLLDGLKQKREEKIKIVYATSRRGNDELSEVYLGALARILDEYGELVEFDCFGMVPAELEKYKNVKKKKYKKNYNRYVQYFFKEGFEIGLAPLLDDEFHNSKTNNKFREYGAMRTCGVYSNAAIYRECVENEVNGILVENTEESWYQALKQLIENPELRERIKENAVQDVREKYCLSNTIEDWKRILQTEGWEKKELNYISKLKVVVLFESQDFSSLTIRWNNAYLVLGSCEADYDFILKSDISLKRLKKYDLALYFTTGKKKENGFIERLSSYVPSVIVDSIYLREDRFRKDSIVYVTPFCEEEDSDVVRIQDENLYNGEMDFMYLAYLKMLENPSEDFGGICRYIEQSEKTRLKYAEHYYSVDAAAVRWMELLEKYHGTKEKPFWLVRILRKLLKKSKHIGNKLIYYPKRICKPVGTFVEKVKNSVGYRFSTWSNMIKINIKKKY